MAHNNDRAAVEDLEALLERGLKIDSSPPRWQSNYANSHYSRNTVPVNSVHVPGTPYYPQQQIPLKSADRHIPENYGAPSPTAIYNPQYRPETQAIPSTSIPTGMRPSTSVQSLGSVNSEQQAAQQLAAQQQAAQQAALQRRQRLEQLQYEQEEQERELETLKRRDRQIREQRHRDQRLAHEAAIQEQQAQYDLQQVQHARKLQHAEEMRLLEQYRQQQDREQQIQYEKQRQEQSAREDRLRREEAQALAQALAESEESAQQHFTKQQQQLYQQHENSRRSAEQQKSVPRSTNLSDSPSSRNDFVSTPVGSPMRASVGTPQQESGGSEGAATMLQRTQDKDGKVTTRVVKKGVEDFDFKEELGAGSYSTVVAAQDKQTLRQYAIKILDKAHIIKEQKVKYVEIEKLTLNRLGNHPGIIRLYFTFQDRQSLYFVLDFAPNGELLNLIKKVGSLNEECARYYAAQLLDAIDYMHKKGVIHRDLKPENILLDYKMRIKITDFGTAKLLDSHPETGEYPTDVRCSSFVGTAEYVSPELLVGKSQGKSTDIWAWGCVLFQMIAAQPPFQGNTQFLTFQKIAKIQYSMPPGFPYIVRELLYHVLVKPQVRYTVEEIKAHEFFSGQDWSSKTVWGTPPPRLQPYKATVASMKPRPLASATGSKHTRVVMPARPTPARSTANVAASSATSSNNSNNTPSGSSAAAAHGATSALNNKQTFVPTSAGLQSTNPNIVHGMPVFPPRDDANRNTPPPTVHSRSAGLGLKAKRPQPSVKATHSSAYQQSQEKIEALKRRMQEQRQISRGNGSPQGPPSASASRSVSGASTSPALHRLNQQASMQSIQRPATPKTPETPTSPGSGYDSPQLPQQPLTQLEAQYSSVLVSAQERILKVGPMEVFVSNHPPPQAPLSRSKPANSASSPGTSANAPGSQGEDDGEDEMVAVADESLFSKLLHSGMKKRLVLITTYGRLLVLGSDNRKVQFEVPLGIPQVHVSEVPFQISDGKGGHSKTNKIIIEAYNKVLTLDDAGEINEWLTMIELSRRYYAQFTADQERNSFNAAAAAASAVAGRRR